MVVFTHVASVLLMAQNNGQSSDNDRPEWRLDRPKTSVYVMLTGHTHTLLLEQTLKSSIVNLRLSLVKF